MLNCIPFGHASTHIMMAFNFNISFVTYFPKRPVLVYFKLEIKHNVYLTFTLRVDRVFLICSNIISRLLPSWLRHLRESKIKPTLCYPRFVFYTKLILHVWSNCSCISNTFIIWMILVLAAMDTPLCITIMLIAGSYQWCMNLSCFLIC